MAKPVQLFCLALAIVQPVFSRSRAEVQNHSVIRDAITAAKADTVFCISQENPGDGTYTANTRYALLKGKDYSDITATSVDQFWNAIDDRMKISNQKIILFVHGYDTSQSTAAIRSGNLDGTSVALLFKWPCPTQSDGPIQKYTRHHNEGIKSVPKLRGLLELLAQRFPGRVTLVAHSHGARFLCEALIPSTKTLIANEIKPLFETMNFIEGDVPVILHQGEKQYPLEGDGGLFDRLLGEKFVGRICSYGSTGDYAMGGSSLGKLFLRTREINFGEKPLGTIHRPIRMLSKNKNKQSDIDEPSTYSVIDIGCLKKTVKAKDSYPSHSEFFYSAELLNVFRHYALAPPLAPISILQFLPQSDIQTVSAKTAGTTRIYRVRTLDESGRYSDCYKEREKKKSKSKSPPL